MSKIFVFVGDSIKKRIDFCDYMLFCDCMYGVFEVDEKFCVVFFRKLWWNRFVFVSIWIFI